ncbi:hypothetical protein BGW42_007595 [Actinomortierella wolfii]|nr:hypothetical protein BGW42_007595 [Actinomortierella wolfii]
MLPFVHTKLVKIDIEGNWDVEVDELVYLLQLLPSLKDLVLGSIHFDKNLEDRDLIEITKTHPALVYVTTRMKRTTEPPSALECIAMVIEFVDNHHDLFNLLTVSKDVFQITARRLYRDPIKSSPDDYDSSIPKLILFLLSLSPARGKTIDILRRSYGLPPFRTPLYPKPMLDYLSALRLFNRDLYMELTWAFVGHRLGEVEELEVEFEDKERYLSNATKMTRMCKIWIRLDSPNYKNMSDLAVAMTANGNDENLLSWAACEAEHYHHQPGGHQLGPLVPLEELWVWYRGYTPFVESARKVIPKLKILQDGLLGFSGSLKWLIVDYPRSHNRVDDRPVKFTIPRPLLKLKLMHLHELTIDRPSWEQVPNIEELILDIDFPQLRDRIATSNGSRNDQNAGVTGVTPLSPTLIDTSTTTTTMTTEQQQQQELPEIWFHCPKLTKLTLENQAVNLLDPNCLYFSPNLQELDLSGWGFLSFDRTTDDDYQNFKECYIKRAGPGIGPFHVYATSK